MYSVKSLWCDRHQGLGWRAIEKELIMLVKIRLTFKVVFWPSEIQFSTSQGFFFPLEAVMRAADDSLCQAYNCFVFLAVYLCRPLFQPCWMWVCCLSTRLTYPLLHTDPHKQPIGEGGTRNGRCASFASCTICADIGKDCILCVLTSTIFSLN